MDKSIADKENIFFARILHDIHTYINSISGAADIISAGEAGSQNEEWVESIKYSCGILHRIINSVLDIQNLKKSFFDIYAQVENKNYNMNSMLSNIINIYKTFLKDNKKIIFLVDIERSIPLNLIGDEIKIRLVLINLITNAIKYTKSGHIILKVSCKKDKSNAAAKQKEVILKFEVSDSGCGIKKENIKRIFEEFVRLDDIRGEGKGLGLSIARTLCTNMNGTIKVKSEFGKGSTFSVTLRQTVVDDKKIVMLSKNKSKIVFIYEENKLYRENILKTLKSLGVAAKIVLQVEDLKYLVTSNYKYAEIFIFVSSSNYTEAISITKETSVEDIVIVCLDCVGEYKPKSEGINFSMPAHLINIVDVLNQSKEILLSKKAQKIFSSITSPNAKVLVVDDNEINLTIMKNFLKPYKMKIVCTKSGSECLKILSENKKASDVFDIIFMDYIMFDKTGIETTIELRKIKEYETVPVVCLTAADHLLDDNIFYEAGMDDILVKPVNFQVISVTLIKFLPQNKIMLDDNFIKPTVFPESFMTYKGNVNRRQGDRRSGDRRAVQNIFNEEEGFLEYAKIISQLRGIKGLNVEKGLSYLDSNKSAYFKMLRQYCANLEKEINSIIEDIENSNWKNYSVKIHSYKGVFAMIGLEDMVAKAEKLEAAGKDAIGITFAGEFIERRRVEDCERICKNETASLILDMKQIKKSLLKTSLFIQKSGVKLLTKIDAKTLLEKLELLKEACLKCRFNTAVDLTDELLCVNYDKKTDLCIKKLAKATAAMEYEEALRIINKIAEHVC
ncbi:MAG: hypothetical protein Ta2G_16880 [Termitinemataceae bacterium]|nr:MAG: hypothetical protein Ta2G_16880 [Termitinemataceae bacterium]